MIGVAEAQKRVARGAAFLDEHRPGWAAEIDGDRLNVADPCRCVVGQLFPAQGFGEAAVAFWPEARTDCTPIRLHGCGVGEADDHGSLDEREGVFALLTEAWRAEIVARLAVA